MARRQTIVRTDEASGRVFLRETAVLAFFLRPPMADLVGAVAAAFDRFIEFIPRGVLKWESVGASSEEWKPFNATTIKRCKAQLSREAAAKRRLTSFEVKDGEKGGDAPSYAFLALGGPARPDKPNEMCLVQMSFPIEATMAESVNEFVTYAREVATAVPFVSGYGAPSLQWAELGREEAIAQSRAIVARHPGYDIQMNTTGRTWLGPRVRGARWLTFLGAELVKTLGGAKQLEAVLPKTVTVEAAGKGLMIRAGEIPEIGDRGSSATTPLLRSVARILEPVTAFEEVVLLGSFADWNKEALEKWERRFLD